ncbi:PREDICTED: uncharacterized protein LOC101309797 [Fragaria vesca subsp. vesca]|uniref:uncharacterized protein LOC101309797 n=1 Tax=Fragaria vesca subsp. vesca TaxID=101020 RepID=UPI0002C2FB52|nr:PREDICTED: uncharacterized protein LOC101309797 [Fragaria vesca subsp. vesca]
MSGFLKNLQTYYDQPRLDSKIEENEDLGCWQEPPEDVKEIIVKLMSFSGRVRLSSLCKSWRSVSMRREIPTCLQLPWLVHPQAETGDSLSFSSLSEGKVFTSRLPCPDFKSLRLNKLLLGTSTNQLQRSSSRFLESSRGWLVMLGWEFYYRLFIQRKQLIIYLLNPVSGAQHRLPPLQTIPGYKEKSDSHPFSQVVLSSPDIDVSTCLVAATLGTQKLLLCRPRDKSWSVFQVFDENDSLGRVNHIMFSSRGIPYALVGDSSLCGDETWIENRSLKFGDDEVELKVIYVKVYLESWADEGFSMQEYFEYKPYLSESTNNELLLIYQIADTNVRDHDVMEGNVVDENDMEGNEQNENVLGWVGQILRKALHLKSFLNRNRPEFPYRRTRWFRVYKIDPDNNMFHRVQDLGDQMLFLADDSSSLSLLATNFKELRGNCIYFATRGMACGKVHTSREIGIFYLDSGRIERSFPSFEMEENSPLSWFVPSLW